MADGIKKISENVTVDKRALVITDPTVPDNDAISIGALQSNPAEKGLKIKVAKNTYSYFDAAHFIMRGTIVTDLLADECVTEPKLGPKAVTEPKLNDSAVSTRTVIDLNITEPKIGPKAVTETKIGDQALVNRHYKDKSISNNKIEDNTLENVKFKDKTLTNSKIADATIIDTLIADKAIKNRHLDLSIVRNENLDNESVYGSKIKIKGVEQKHLADNAVNTINVLNGAITGIKIPPKQIGPEHLIEQAVNTIHYANNSVTNIKLAQDSVGTINLINKSVTKNKLGDDVVSLIGDPVQYDSDDNVSLRKNLTVNGNINAIGNITAAKVYNAVFMDIAEGYEPQEGEIFIPGDIVAVNDAGKLERATPSEYPIVGIVSEEYAACYGATEEELKTGKKIAVGLIGKVHVNVAGPVKLGDKIGLFKSGYGASIKTNNIVKDYIIGKALESSEDGGLKKVLCLIYPN